MKFIVDRVFINYHTRGSGGVANTTGESRGRGRPRDAQVRAAVLQAAAELALAGGAGAASIDAIAKRAAVSRTTVYKWWPSAASIVLEGLLESLRGSITRPAGSTTMEALEHHLRALNAILSAPVTGPLLRSVVAAANADPELATAVLDQWLLPRRAAVTAVLIDAAAVGEVRRDLDVEVVVDALFSPPYYRLVFGLPPLDDAALTQLLETVWRGCIRGDDLPPAISTCR